MLRFRADKKALLVLSMLLALLAGCAKPQPSFPILGPEQTSATAITSGPETQQPITEPQDETIHLRLAVPFSDEAGQALRLLFLARESGLLSPDDNPIGHTVDLDNLMQFDAPLTFEIISVPAAAGVSAEQARLWQASDGLPDLLYCSAAASVPGHEQLLPLQGWLYDEALISPRLVYPMAIESLKSGEAVHGVPFLASTAVICHDAGLLASLGAKIPDSTMTWYAWSQWLSETQLILADRGLSAAPSDLADLEDDLEARKAYLEKAVLINAQLSAYLPFIAPSLIKSAGWGMWQGYGFSLDQPVFLESAAWLRELAQAGYGMDHLAEADLKLFQGSQSLSSERVVSQVIDSAQMVVWDGKTGFNAGFSLMPGSSLKESSADAFAVRLPLHVRVLSISRDTAHPELCARLAIFLALDPDSLLMQSRFQLYEGLVPLVRDPFIWEQLVAGQMHGDLLMVLQSALPQTYAGGQQTVKTWAEIMEQAFRQGGSRYLSADDTEAAEAIKAIAATAAKLLSERR